MMIDNFRPRYCQRGFIDWITVVLYGLAAAAVIAALYGAWYQLDHWHNAAYRELEAQVAVKDARIAALESEKAEAQASAAVWEKRAEENLAQLDGAVRANQERNDETIASLNARARTLQGRLVRVSADLTRVLNDAAVAANTDHPAAPAVDQGSAPAVPDAAEAGTRLATYDEGELAAWVVGAAAAYASCRIKHAACVKAYESLPQEQSP